MSTRILRKLYGTSTLPPLEGNSDEEFEPLYAKEKSSKSLYAGLEIGDSCDSDNKTLDIEVDDNQPDVKTKQNKKKKKKRQRKTKLVSIPSTVDGKELDEIDKSVLEVNAILGAPTAPPSPTFTDPDLFPPLDPVNKLFSIKGKHLNYENEVKRMLGSETLDENGKPRKYRPHNVVKYKRAFIVPTSEKLHFRRVGLSMSLIDRKNGLSYFTIDHNRDYQKLHQTFLEASVNGDDGMAVDPSNQFHIEGLLEYADFMLRSEEYGGANNLIEQIIACYQYIFHPSFNLTDRNIRLEYKYLENRPFHIAVLKFLHMLSNMARHRTALELAKLLLTLDPSDPLAMIYIIDTLALRAREHYWLVQAIDHWKKERDAGYLFNIQYSYALAYHHVLMKMNYYFQVNPDELMQDAMMHFPTLTSWILETAMDEDSVKIKKHPLFSPTADTRLPEMLNTAYKLHAKLVCWRYREHNVLKWFTKNALEVIAKYDADPDVRKHVEELAVRRQRLFARCPVEIHRHLLVVRSMANLLVEWELPRMSRQRAWDPLPPSDGVNRYRYGLVEVDGSYYTVLFNLFSSVMPNFVPAELHGVEVARNVGGGERGPQPPQRDPQRDPQREPQLEPQRGPQHEREDASSTEHTEESDYTDTDSEAAAELNAMRTDFLHSLIRAAFGLSDDEPESDARESESRDGNTNDP